MNRKQTNQSVQNQMSKSGHAYSQVSIMVYIYICIYMCVYIYMYVYMCTVR